MESFLGESLGDAAGVDENREVDVSEAERLRAGIVEGYRDWEAGRVVRFCGDLQGLLRAGEADCCGL